MLRDIVRVIEKTVPRVSQEVIPAMESLGRVAARTVRAGRNLPAFDVSALDGFACRGSGNAFVAKGSLEPGQRGSVTLKAGEAIFVPTGAAIPAGSRFVPREYVTEEGMRISVETAEDIRKVWRKGYWIGKGEHVVRKGQTIGPRTMELLALAGLASVPVYRKPGARLLSTGNELKKGIVVNSNQYLLTGLLQRDGGEVVGCAIAGDDEREIAEALSHVKDSDFLLVTGGTAKGIKDVTRAAFQASGAVFLLESQPIVPGKTMAFGTIDDIPFFILPGNPRALRTLYEVFVRPCLAKLCGRVGATAVSRARAPEDIEKDPDTIHLIPVLLSEGHPVRIEQLHVDEPNGFLVLERGTTRVRAGEEVSVQWVNG